MLNTLTGNTYNYDATTKQIKRTGALNTVADSTKSVILGNLIESVITGTRRGFTANIVNSDDETFFDGFGDTKIDMSDLDKITDPVLKAALIAHIIEERLTYPNGNYSAAVQRMDLYDPCHKQALIKEVEVINEMLGLTTTATKFKVREDEVEKGPSGTSTYSYWKFYSTTTSRIYRIDADVVPCKKWDPVAEMNDTVLGCFRMGGIIYSVTR